MAEPEPIYIHGLRVENYMGIELVELRFDPKGGLIEVTGENEQGKSSLLGAIRAVMGGKAAIPEEAVRTGADEADITLDLGDKLVTLSIDPDGSSALKLKTQEGASFSSPQTFLNKLKGEYTFDPLAYSRLDSGEQATALLKFVGVDFTSLDRQRRDAYAERRLVNKEGVHLKALFDALPPLREPAPAGEKRDSSSQRAAYKTARTALETNAALRADAEAAAATAGIREAKIAMAKQALVLDREQLADCAKQAEGRHLVAVRINEILQGLHGLAGEIREVDISIVESVVLSGDASLPLEDVERAERRVIALLERFSAQARREQESIETRIARAEADMVSLEESHLAAKETSNSLQARIADLVDPVLAVLEVELDSIDEGNDQVQARLDLWTTYNADKKARDVQAATLDAKRNESAALTAKIKSIDGEKAALQSNAKFPVDGLGVAADYDEDGHLKEQWVVYQGRRLASQSKARRLRICMDIAAAFNPRLRVIIVEEGSDLDQQQLKDVAIWAKEKGYQLFLERVAGDKPVGIVIRMGKVHGDYRNQG